MTDAAHNQHRHHLSATLLDRVGDLQAFREVVLNLAVEGNRTMDDVGERRRATRRSCVETERDVGLEVARKWAKEDDKYRALLRIAQAVEEARRETMK